MLRSVTEREITLSLIRASVGLRLGETRAAGASDRREARLVGAATSDKVTVFVGLMF